jgi:hypothetical protein
MNRVVARSGLVVAGAILAGVWFGGNGATAAPEKDDPAVARARKTVRMLDDVYKTAVVLITDKYVHDEADFPAGSAAIALFSAIEKKGWHSVRLIDVSGEPYDPENVAKSDFEKNAVKAMKAGKDYFEEIVERDGKPVLLAATAVPVVMDKCVMCHPNYKNAAKGAAIGSLVYSLPIE